MEIEEDWKIEDGEGMKMQIEALRNKIFFFFFKNSMFVELMGVRESKGNRVLLQSQLSKSRSCLASFVIPLWLRNKALAALDSTSTLAFTIITKLVCSLIFDAAGVDRSAGTHQRKRLVQQRGYRSVFFPPWQHINIYIFCPVNECMCEYSRDYIKLEKSLNSRKAHRALHVVLKLWGSTSVAAISLLPGGEDIK